MKKRFFWFSFLILVFTASSALAINPPKINATAYPGEKVFVYWDEVPGAAGYNVYRKAGNAGTFTKLASLIQSKSFDDKNVTQGNDYEYFVKAVANNVESAQSNVASAPNMYIKTEASVKGFKKDNVFFKGEKTVNALPGDIINYKILITNNGYGKAANTVVTYPVPSGTRLILTSVDKNNFNADISCFDNKKGAWEPISTVENAKNISKVRFSILDSINTSVTGHLAFDVIIET